MPPRTLVIVNPASRSGRTRKIFDALEARLRDALGPLEVDWTQGPRDAERLAREGARAGVERILVAGGDGTASEVVAGVLAADLADEIQIGFLPLGTGKDLVRGLGLAMNVEEAITDIAAGRTRQIDAGRLHYLNHGGEPRVTSFINSATVGISGLIVQLVNESGKGMGGSLAFLLGTLRALARFQPAPATLELDGTKIYEGDLVLATACNGPFFGGGMRGAPGACFDDGLLDVVVIPGLTKARLLRRLPNLYAGTHIEVPGVLRFQGRELLVSAAPGSQLLEIDGEPLGCAPVRFEVLPEAVTLVGVKETNR
ncbi:MAG: diacylglycerol kinase family lipid kinase [Deltaproteobacteria bacterium]|nr:diacylglycerol kinase family lipid kinase [Deltaproteobacteria bacterium]MBW2393272.1 diacylglycerol kinase family lipid kinase [Deltaproteobacteria bacterium]